MTIFKQISILVLLVGLAAGGYVKLAAILRQWGWRATGCRRSAREAVEFLDLETLVAAIGSTLARRRDQFPRRQFGGSRRRPAMPRRSAGTRHCGGEGARPGAGIAEKASDVTAATVDKLVAELAIATADRDRAECRLRDRTVVARFAGTVGFSNVELGGRIKKGDTICAEPGRSYAQRLRPDRHHPVANNGILIAEFANQLRDTGASVRDAVVDAAVLQLRPIVMTVISTILGAVPLVLTTGARAESGIAIGSVIVGGLGLALVFTLFLTPVLCALLADFSKPRSAVENALEAELAGVNLSDRSPSP